MKSAVRNFARSALAAATGTAFAQSMLDRAVFGAHMLMGIGSSGDVFSSGEHGILRLLQNVPPPYCVFDIGANKGQFLELLLTNLSEAAVVAHCFEPSKSAFAILQQRASTLMCRHASASIQLVPEALGKTRGRAALHYDAPGSGLASLSRRRLDHFDIAFDQEEEVVIQTLDHYCEEHGVKDIDLLKMDVEGHELDVLAGATKVFQRRAVRACSFEFGGANIDTHTHFQNFWYFFQDAGMHLYRVTPSGFLMPLRKYSETQEQFRTTNFVAARS